MRQLAAVRQVLIKPRHRTQPVEGLARAVDLRRSQGIEPTNNHAERALRGAVIYRKLSLGSQSDDGERRIERLLSIHTTCRLQRRPLHDYLIAAFTDHSRGDPVPVLA